MSSTIDRRIVEMQFDNKQFEKGIGESVKSLGQLKKSLQLDGAADGLKELQRAGKAFTLSGIADSVDAISQRFTTMGIIGMRTLQNIADSAYRAGKRMASALTVQPVKMGFGEYETQINAVQTILANTRTEMKEKGYNEAQSLGVITQKLDELNTYADQTIYNFTEMTRNIGTFTAAGVELDKSVAAIKGMSNLAAISGSTPQQASNAMYQMSQALSSGVVRAIDWNSMVNAGMGGEVFKNALINTARAMNVQVDHTVDKINEKGKLVKETVKMNVDQVLAADGGFKESLQSEWLTADVMIATLNQFSIDLEKTAREMGLYLQDGTLNLEAAKNEILGDLYAQGFTKEQAEEIIDLAEMAKGAATEVKTLTQLFSTLNESLQSGWTQSWEYILGDFNEAKAFFTEIGNHFGDMIQASADARNKVLLSWKNMGGRDLMIESFWNIVTAIENVVNTIRGAFQEFFPPATAEQLYSVTEGINEFTEKIKMATENTELMDKVGRVFRGVAAAADIAREAVLWVWDGFTELVGASEGVAGGLLDVLASVGDSIVAFREYIKKSQTIQDIFAGLKKTFIALGTTITSWLRSIGDFFSYLWEEVSKSEIFANVTTFFSDLISYFPDFIASIGEWGQSIVDWVKDSEKLSELWGNVKGFLIPIGDAISEFATGLWDSLKAFFSGDFDWGKLWEGIKEKFISLGTKIRTGLKSAWDSITPEWESFKTRVDTLFTETMPALFTSIKANAIARFPWLEQALNAFEEAWAKIKETFKPLTERLRDMVDTVWGPIRELFGIRDESEDVTTFAESIGEFISSMWTVMNEGFGEFFNKTLPKWIKKLKKIDLKGPILNLLGIFTTFEIVKALRGIAKFSSGIGSIGKGLKEIGGMLKNVGKEGLTLNKVIQNKDSFATSMLKVASAMALMVASITILGNMEAGKAWKGINLMTFLAAELITIGVIFKKLDIDGEAIFKAAGAVALMTVPIFALGHMDFGSALRGIFLLGLVLAEIVGFTRLAKEGAKGKHSFMSLAGAVLILTLVIKSLGGMRPENALAGIFYLGLIFAEIAGFTKFAKGAKTKGLMSMALTVMLLAGTVKKLGSMNFDTALKGILALGGILTAMALYSRFAGNSSGSAGLMSLALVIGVFTIALKSIEGVDTGKVLAFGGVLSVMVLAAAAAVKILGTMPVTGVAKGAAALILVAAALGIAMNILGGLMGNALTSFSQEMYQVGANLLGYSDLVSGLDKGAIDTSIEVIGDLAAVAATVAVTNTAGIEGFSTSITRLGGSLNLYSSLIENVSSEKSQAVRTVVDDVGYVAGKMDELSGGSIDVDSLGLVLGTLGSGLKLYSESLKSVDFTAPTEGAESAVSTGTYIKQAFEDIAENLPTSDVIAKVSACAEGGGDDMTSFALGLTAIGTAISSFNDSVANLDDTKVMKAGLFVQMMSSIESGLTTHGSAIEWFKGKKQTLSDFSTDIVVIGQAIGTFGESVKGIDDTKVTNAGNAITMLSNIQEGLSKTDGVLQWFTGTSSLGDFATELNTLGPALKQFSDNIENFDSDKVSDATAPIDALIAIKNRLTDTNGVLQWFSGEQSLAAFGSDISKFGSNLFDFYTYIEGITIPDNMDSIFGNVETLAGYAERMQNVKDVYDLSDFIKWLGEDIQTFFDVNVSDIDTSSAWVFGMFIDRVADAALKLQGIEVDKWAISDLMSSITLPEMPDDAYASVLSQVPVKLEAIIASVLGYQGDFESAGRTLGGNLGHGMAQGISSMAGRVRSAAISAASGAIHAIQISWAIHSPSRITRKFGENFDFGLIEGIDGYSGMVIDSAQRVAEGAVDGFGSSMNLISGLEEELDYSPHIRPVLDLDDVINGMHTMDGMFASDRRIRGYFNGGISIDGMRGMRQDRKGEPVKHDNRDVVEAIHKLGERFDELSARMDGIQIVLDSGALVGHTSAQMDAKLGALASRRSRGN